MGKSRTPRTNGGPNLILAVAVVATTLVSAALMVLASIFFDLGY
jgi:hypothetical protein